MVMCAFHPNRSFVIGSPIEHSLSPTIHNYWLRKYKKKGNYQAINIAYEDLEIFIAGLREKGFLGGNVTLPYKETLFSFVDQVDPIARMIGAINCLYFKENQLWGTNSDAYGFLTYLDLCYQDQPYEEALVLGAGGASRAVLYALLQKNIKKIYLANRTYSKAQTLAKLFGDRIIPIFFEEADTILSAIDLVVNTTSIGLGQDANKIESKFPLNFRKIKSTAIAYDIVYKPLKTPFLKEAEAQKIRTIDGLGMLIYQAVPCFALWYGIQPIVDNALRELLIEKAQL